MSVILSSLRMEVVSMNERITFQCTQEQKQELEQAALSQNMTLSEYLQKALEVMIQLKEYQVILKQKKRKY